ncbi:MAG: hypothetical protein HOI19_04520 [Rhodospirillaceae bacterium]|nr:hypothetical protein [Rhodospirillaceae bacterium]
MSIDTSLVLGDHEVHPDRGEEYVEYIPKIGEDMLVRCNVSVNDDIHEKQSTFSHYTTGALERIKI